MPSADHLGRHCEPLDRGLQILGLVHDPLAFGTVLKPEPMAVDCDPIRPDRQRSSHRVEIGLEDGFGDVATRAMFDDRWRPIRLPSRSIESDCQLQMTMSVLATSPSRP